MEWASVDDEKLKLDPYTLKPIIMQHNLGYETNESDVPDYQLALTGDVFRWMLEFAPLDTMQRVCLFAISIARLLIQTLRCWSKASSLLECLRTRRPSWSSVFKAWGIQCTFVIRHFCTVFPDDSAVEGSLVMEPTTHQLLKRPTLESPCRKPRHRWLHHSPVNGLISHLC